jgi:hypothetical protein
MFSSSNSSMIEQNHWNILCHKSETLEYKLVFKLLYGILPNNIFIWLLLFHNK